MTSVAVMWFTAHQNCRLNEDFNGVVFQMNIQYFVDKNIGSY